MKVPCYGNFGRTVRPIISPQYSSIFSTEIAWITNILYCCWIDTVQYVVGNLYSLQKSVRRLARPVLTRRHRQLRKTSRSSYYSFFHVKIRYKPPSWSLTDYESIIHRAATMKQEFENRSHYWSFGAKRIPKSQAKSKYARFLKRILCLHILFAPTHLEHTHDTIVFHWPSYLNVCQYRLNVNQRLLYINTDVERQWPIRYPCTLTWFRWWTTPKLQYVSQTTLRRRGRKTAHMTKYRYWSERRL